MMHYIIRYNCNDQTIQAHACSGSLSHACKQSRGALYTCIICMQGVLLLQRTKRSKNEWIKKRKGLGNGIEN